MPRIKINSARRARPATWQQTIIDRIRGGKLVPLIANSIGNDLVLAGHHDLVDAYANYSDFPLEPDILPRMAQFKGITDERITDELALKDDYVNFIKNRLFDIAEHDDVDPDLLAEVEEQFDNLTFSQFCSQLGYPRFENERSHPLLLLATFDLPIYITTCYHDFVEVALRQAGKSPRTDICRWHNELEDIPSVFDGDYVPTPSEPLVYHLHGYDEFPDSLVLTEDDFLAFLVATSQNVGRATDPINARIRQAMSDSSLMLLGYKLREWDFRSTFWGLIEPRTRQLTSVLSIQLAPTEIEKLYLQKYLGEHEFKVFWGTVEDYLRSLYEEVTNG